MNIVVIDYANIHPDAEFPWLKTRQEYRWSQHPHHGPAEIREDCWRAHVLVTVATPIDAETIAALPKLAYVIEVSDRGLVDRAAAAARDIEVIPLVGAEALTPVALCQRIVDELDALIGRAS
jgi:glycerate dehydrogenase